MHVSPLHHIQKHILRTLTHQKWARFRDMRPPRTDSNLYSYHLKLLLKEGMIEKHAEKGYRLSPAGLRYVDHVSLERFEPRWQPKLITKLFIQDDEGRILLWPKYKQPFIGTWSLPSGKVHYDDRSVLDAARRELGYITNRDPLRLEHRGVMEINAVVAGDLVTHVLEHLFIATIENGSMIHEQATWMTLDEIVQAECSPGTEEAIEQCIKDGPFFYRHYDIEW